MEQKIKIANTFVNCFKIAKRNRGVLYWSPGGQYSNGRYRYSPCKDLFGEPIIDFRTTNTLGKELNNTDRKSFYKVKI
jgi:hypothetical protein